MSSQELPPRRWERICAIASMVLDADKADREEILERECASDSELRVSVQGIVENYSESEDLLGLKKPVMAGFLVKEFQHGDIIGAYRIEKKIGEGGMGRVYLASRADDAFTKLVAIKVSTFPSATLEGRFRTERSILAQMEHAGIARLLDAGTTPEGALYVVMEYVDGLPVDAYCDEHKLDTRARLELFDKICEAIAYAHAQGILHCDLKPSNVFVNREGIPKLLDFGLAKSGDAAPEGLLAFTPTFASPELKHGKAVGPYSDVYSLGMVLERLLPGQIDQDLQSILNKAKQELPAHRYQTVAELAEDLLRFRSRFPVKARQQTAAYVTGRFLQRNLLEISAGVVFLFAMGQFTADWRSEARVSSAKSVQQITSLRGRETFPSMSGDGKQVAFASIAAGHWDIYVKREGAEPVNLTSASGVENSEPAFSPDGKQIAFRSEREGGGIFLMDASGGGVRKLSDQGYQPAWSPDGKRIALSTATFPFGRIALTGVNRRSHLLLVDVASGAKWPLTRDTDIQDAVQAAWSPNGRTIVFWGIDSDGEMYVYTTATDGTIEKPKVIYHQKGVTVWNPFWSPSGRYVYFDSSSSGTANLWRIAVDQDTGSASGEPVRVTIPIALAGFFSPSKNGKRLAYTQDHEAWNIERAPFDVTTFRLGTAVPVTEGANHFIRPVVAPDGEWVVFQTPDRPAANVYVCRSSGGVAKQVTHVGKSRFPRWLDNEHIGYTTTRDGVDQVVEISKDGSGERVMLEQKSLIGQFWQLSRDKMLFSMGGKNFFTFENKVQTPFRTPNGPNEIFRLHGISADRKIAVVALMPASRREENPLQIYDMASGALTPLGVKGANAAFLQDERYVRYTKANRIMVFDRKSGEDHEVFQPGADELSGISFSADQKWLYFSRSRAAADVWVAEMDPPL